VGVCVDVRAREREKKKLFEVQEKLNYIDDISNDLKKRKTNMKGKRMSE
jgi:hypothetical protein